MSGNEIQVTYCKNSEENAVNLTVIESSALGNENVHMPSAEASRTIIILSFVFTVVGASAFIYYIKESIWTPLPWLLILPISSIMTGALNWNRDIESLKKLYEKGFLKAAKYLGLFFAVASSVASVVHLSIAMIQQEELTWHSNYVCSFIALISLTWTYILFRDSRNFMAFVETTLHS